MNTLIDVAADLLLGGRCPGCDRPGHGLCPGCRQLAGTGRVHFAGRTPSPPGYPPTVCGGEYAGVLRRVVVRYKDERLLALAGVLAERLMVSVVHLVAALGRVGETYRLVPVPSRPAVVRERGLDHTAALARRTARLLRRRSGLVAPIDRALHSTGRAVDQVGLDAGARLVNRDGQFIAARRPGPATAILLDDVTTTGATLAAAASTLRQAGVPVLGAAVIAATVRRHPPRS